MIDRSMVAPSARPTAIHSRIIFCMRLAACGVAAMLAYLLVMVEMAPELFMQSFFHAAVVQSSVRVMVILSVGNRLANCCDSALLGTVIRMWPNWVTIPGAVRSAGQSMITGTMRSMGM